MSKLNEYTGYQEDFLGSDLRVPMPALHPDQLFFVAPVKGTKDNILRYHNFSVIQNSDRRFPFLTAANIDGNHFVELRRKDIFTNGRDRWRKDSRISYKHQWGSELYSAKKSDFDRGHMTKREDVQWGPTSNLAREGARSTFYYTNSVPQHRELNQELWRSLEDYILHEETLDHGLKINLFTGPLLTDDDPEFVTAVREEVVKIPKLFWKVIYYTRDGSTLNRVAFLAGQEGILVDRGIVHPPPVKRGFEDPFQDFKLGDTFQVQSAFIEELTGFKFPEASDPYQDGRPEKLVLEEVDLPVEVATRGLGAPVPRKTIALRGLTL